MDKIAIVTLFLMPAIVCSAAAFYLAAHGKDGWGWFLFAAILMASVKITGVGSGP